VFTACIGKWYRQKRAVTTRGRLNGYKNKTTTLRRRHEAENKNVHFEIEIRPEERSVQTTLTKLQGEGVGFNYKPGRCLPFYLVFTCVAATEHLTQTHARAQKPASKFLRRHRWQCSILYRENDVFTVLSAVSLYHSSLTSLGKHTEKDVPKNAENRILIYAHIYATMVFDTMYVERNFLIGTRTFVFLADDWRPLPKWNGYTDHHHHHRWWKQRSLLAMMMMSRYLRLKSQPERN